MYNQLKTNNIKIIFDIDDDLLNIDITHTAFERYSNLKNIFLFMINNSDIITVSTPHLKNELKKYNENIIIVPNTLMKFWNLNTKQEVKNLNSKRKIKIGYFGTRTHESDLQLLKESIINVKTRLPDKIIIFEVAGVCRNNHDWVNKITIPHNYKQNPTPKDRLKNIIAYFLDQIKIPHSLPYCNFISWMKNEIDWDIAVAPLDDTNINQSKSNLKYLEYTALNIPGIYSNLGPYKEIKIKNTGIVVDNTTLEWEKAIISLIENNELYETIMRNAYEDIEKNYLVENASTIWKDILNTNSY